ncbi:hypothetical protein J6590_016919 [Homalodisca vitripennis]|nr:hypothetical protein J6590_016919 [Homalodisca vitripennis]
MTCTPARQRQPTGDRGPIRPCFTRVQIIPIESGEHVPTLGNRLSLDQGPGGGRGLRIPSSKAHYTVGRVLHVNNTRPALPGLKAAGSVEDRAGDGSDLTAGTPGFNRHLGELLNLPFKEYFHGILSRWTSSGSRYQQQHTWPVESYLMSNPTVHAEPRHSVVSGPPVARPLPKELLTQLCESRTVRGFQESHLREYVCRFIKYKPILD